MSIFTGREAKVLKKFLILPEKKTTGEETNSNKVNYSYHWKSLAAGTTMEWKW